MKYTNILTNDTNRRRLVSDDPLPIRRTSIMERVRREARMAVWPPVLVWAGSLLFAVGAAADLLFHLLPAPLPALAGLLGPAGGRAHLTTLLGMVLVMAGVLLRGVRHVH
jgi:hypothetical protein